MSNLKHQRILVKFSGESVAGDDEHGIDPKILDQMASGQRKSCRESKTCERRSLTRTQTSRIVK